MNLPPPVAEGLTALLQGVTGSPETVREVQALGGGCINEAGVVVLNSGRRLFVKWHPHPPPTLFRSEARGLEELARASALRVPGVLGHSEADHPGPGWLALEYLPPGQAPPSYDRQLGSGLAELHRNRGSSRVEGFGLDHDNYIGSLPQHNGPSPSWSSFWQHARLEPQMDRARSWLSPTDVVRFERLFARLPDLLAPGQAEGPSLLHGDLWSGNAFPGPDGVPVLIDPAIYLGHREVDLAMTELFGGFSASFYHAYEQAWPLTAGYAPRRRATYQLYPLLVHLNLFGASYLGRVRVALELALS